LAVAISSDTAAALTRTRAEAAVVSANRMPECSLPTQYVTRLVSELAADDAIFTCDVGTPIIWTAVSEGQWKAAHHWFVQSRVDGECDAAGDRRAGDVPGSPGHLDVR
jgi:hypothetical protein